VTPDTYIAVGIDPALRLLPNNFDSPSARAMMMAIAWQESRLQERTQLERGPARGYPQFELGGVTGVLRHPATAPLAAAFVNELDYSDLSPAELHATMQWDTVLMAGMTRLNLWWHAAPLPSAWQRDAGWAYYLFCWRPGKPKPLSWPESWTVGWDSVS
jgi:hypothetical protein